MGTRTIRDLPIRTLQFKQKNYKESQSKLMKEKKSDRRFERVVILDIWFSR